MDCITDNELVELLEDRLPSARRATVLAELEGCAECRALAQQWAAASDRASTAPVGAPPAVGGYRLGDVIGAGAMGLVFRAHDDTLDRDVAVKIVRADDDAARERALAEGRMLATIRHPNVISVHAAGAGDGIAYLAMELATGTSLDRVLAGGPIAPATAVRWFRGVAAGLAAAHDAGVIHRDIKPANLLLDRDHLRIADFGLAATRGGAPAGTLAYLAPEVGDGAQATPASDQFAFCVTLYEALAARRPFAALDLAGLRAAWRGGVTSWSGVPARLRAVLARGLARDPAARWPSMADVERALERAQRPRRWPAIAAAAAVAAVLAASAGWLALREATPACAVPDPGWLARTASGPPDLWTARLRSLAFAYTLRWRAAYADTCAGSLAPRQRACLDAARARIDAMFDSLGEDTGDGVQALAAAQPPERCITAPDAPPAAGTVTSWRRAQALADLGRYADARAALPAGDGRSDSAELAYLRGNIARELSDLPAAEAALRRAVEQASRRDAGGVLADAETDLAVVVGFLQDRHEAGTAYADAALAAAERLGDRRRIAIARCVQGLLVHARGNPVAGAALLASGIAELVRIGAPPLDLATAELRLGWVLREAQRPRDARPHFERAVALRRSLLGPEHPLTATAEVEIGMTEASAGDYAAAIARYRAVLEVHPEHTGALSALGTAQLQSGDYAGAEDTGERVLALRRAAYGDRHVDVARAYTNLGSVLYYEGKYGDAIDAYRAAEATARSLLGGKHPEVATIRTGVAIALQAQSRFPEAAAAIADAIAIYRELPGHDRELADALMTQGTIELAAHHLVTARSLLEESEAIQRRQLGEDHVDLAYVLAALGELYLAMDRLADAQRVLERARALRTEHGVAPQLVAENDYVLAMVAWKQQRPAVAREHARSALALLGDARPELRAEIAAWLRSH